MSLAHLPELVDEERQDRTQEAAKRQAMKHKNSFGATNPSAKAYVFEFGTVVINFVILAFVIFLIVRYANKHRQADAPAGPSEAELLAEIRDELRKR